MRIAKSRTVSAGQKLDRTRLAPWLVLLGTLQNVGYEVLAAPNGATGLKLFDPQPVDLVITDLIMPEKERLETILELRRHRPGQKVIAISGGGNVLATNFLPLAQKLGVTRTLAKPFAAQTILDAVGDVLLNKPETSLDPART